MGGDEGAVLIDGARAAMVAAGIRRPDRFAAMLAPGQTFASGEATTRSGLERAQGRVVAPDRTDA